MKPALPEVSRKAPITPAAAAHADIALVTKVAPLDATATRAEIENAERKYIVAHIQPWVERDHVISKLNERVNAFAVHGSGIDKRIEWQVQSGVACQGCYGRGDISSHKGTRTECPDCWGGGVDYGGGEIRTLTTDYDGDLIGQAA